MVVDRAGVGTGLVRETRGLNARAPESREVGV